MSYYPENFEYLGGQTRGHGKNGVLGGGGEGRRRKYFFEFTWGSIIKSLGSN